MLVTDRHSLQPIHFLNLVDEKGLQFLRPENLKDVVRQYRALGQLLAFLHPVALEYNAVLADRHEVLLFIARFLIANNHRTLAANDGAKVEHAINLCNLSSILRLACLKQLGHSRQSAGDILGLGGLAGRLGKERAGGDLVILIHLHVSAGWNRVVRHHVTGLVLHNNLRMQIFLVLNDHLRVLAGGRIHFLIHRDSCNDVDETNLAGFLCQDRNIVGIPPHEGSALSHLVPICDGDHGSNWDIVILKFLVGLGIMDRYPAILVQDNVTAILQVHDTQTFILHHAAFLGLDFWLLENR